MEGGEHPGEESAMFTDGKTRQLRPGFPQTSTVRTIIPVTGGISAGRDKWILNLVWTGKGIRAARLSHRGKALGGPAPLIMFAMKLGRRHSEVDKNLKSLAGSVPTPHTGDQLLLTKLQKQCNGENTVFSTNAIGKIRHS
jgi:hypothetical protein